MAAFHKGEFTHSLKGGVVAGIIGGIVIALLLLASSLLMGMDPWPAMKGAGAPFLGERAMRPGFDGLALVVGVICHFAVSIGWGILFGLLFYGLSHAATLGAGVLWGLVVWLGMYYVILPIVGLGKMAEGAPMWRAALYHVIFGVAVALGFLPYQRRVHRTARALPTGTPTTPTVS